MRHKRLFSETPPEYVPVHVWDREEYIGILTYDETRRRFNYAGTNRVFEVSTVTPKGVGYAKSIFWLPIDAPAAPDPSAHGFIAKEFLKES